MEEIFIFKVKQQQQKKTITLVSVEQVNFSERFNENDFAVIVKKMPKKWFSSENDLACLQVKVNKFRLQYAYYANLWFKVYMQCLMFYSRPWKSLHRSGLTFNQQNVYKNDIESCSCTLWCLQCHYGYSCSLT